MYICVMGLRKSEVISLRKLCQDTKINYTGVYNNLRKKVEFRTFTEDQISKLFDHLDDEVLKFKQRFYE